MEKYCISTRFKKKLSGSRTIAARVTADNVRLFSCGVEVEREGICILASEAAKVTTVELRENNYGCGWGGNGEMKGGLVVTRQLA